MINKYLIYLLINIYTKKFSLDMYIYAFFPSRHQASPMPNVF